MTEISVGQSGAFRKARIDWPLVILVVIAVTLWLVIARPMLLWWYWEWTKPESYYQHAPLIPFLAGLMIWHRREALFQCKISSSAWALTVLIPAIALLVLAIRSEMQAVQSFAFLAIFSASVWLLLGAQVVRATRFALAFLWLMAPLPGPVLNDATLRTQMWSTVLANKLLHVLSFQTTLQGNVIQMDNFNLFVDVPCSGFHLVLSLMTLSAAILYLVDGDRTKRILLFLLSFPLSIAVNTLRIALIGVVGECMGTSAAHVFHDWSGVLTVFAGVGVILGLSKGIGCRTFAGWPLF